MVLRYPCLKKCAESTCIPVLDSSDFEHCVGLYKCILKHKVWKAMSYKESHTPLALKAMSIKEKYNFVPYI